MEFDEKSKTRTLLRNPIKITFFFLAQFELYLSIYTAFSIFFCMFICACIARPLLPLEQIRPRSSINQQVVFLIKSSSYKPVYRNQKHEMGAVMRKFCAIFLSFHSSDYHV